MSSPTNAIILAAGHGSRMGALTAERPKALLSVAGYSLIDRQIDALTISGISNITVVTGYKHHVLHDHLGSRVSYVHNERYGKSNSLYSLWLAREILRRGAIVMNSDILVSPILIARLLAAKAHDAALVDPRNDMGAEEMKVRLSNGFIAEFSKDLPLEKASGENVGILKFSREGGTRLVKHLDTLVHIGMTNAWAPLAFSALTREWPIVAVSTHGIPWTEIDFPEDLARAEQELAPQLAATGSAPRNRYQYKYGGQTPVRDCRMKLFAAAALGVGLFIWTIASVGVGTLVAQVSQLGVMLPLVMLLAAVRFALQAAGWRLAMGSSPRPSLLQAIRAVIAGEAAGYLTWGPISREPVKALMVSAQTPERVSLSAAIVERLAYMGAATGLVALSLTLVAVRANRADWIAPGLAAAIIVAALWMVVKRRIQRTGLKPCTTEENYQASLEKYQISPEKFQISREKYQASRESQPSKERSQPSRWHRALALFAQGGRLFSVGALSPATLAALVSLATLQEIINVLETYAVLTWLGAAPTLEASIALEGLNRLANAPAQLIPGKLGVLELAGSTFASALQLGNANGLTLVLARRVRSLAWTGVGILLFTTSASRARTVRHNPAIV